MINFSAMTTYFLEKAASKMDIIIILNRLHQEGASIIEGRGSRNTLVDNPHVNTSGKTSPSISFYLFIYI